MARPFPSPAPAVYLLAAALGLVAAPAGAEDGWHGSVAATSRYVFRGLLLRGDAPALQADLHRRASAGSFGDLTAIDSAFAGVWVSTGPARRGLYGRHEINLYAGFGLRATDRWSLALRAVHYAYPDSRLGSRYDYDELSATASFDDRWSFTLSASPNTTLFSGQGLVERRRTRAFEVSLRQGLMGPVSLVAAAGYYDTEALFGTAYRAWNVGLAARMADFDLNLTRFGTDRQARQLFRASAADGRWALSAAWSF